MSAKEVSHVDPKSTFTMSKVATFGGLEESERTLHSAEKSLEINPNDAYAWYQKGAALNNLNRYEEAMKSFNRATEIQPNLATAWYNKGSALVALGEYEEAMKSFDIGISINPNDPRAWYHKGAALVNNIRKYKQALECLDKSIEIDPKTNPAAWTDRSVNMMKP
jgi:tetratricopeptide (TPR) repeat protein